MSGIPAVKFLYMRMFSSDWFYPSECEERRVVDRGSLQATIRWSSDLFETSRREGVEGRFTSSLRSVAWFVAIVGIGLLQTSLLPLWSVGEMGKYTVVWLCKSGVERQEAAVKIREHAIKFFLNGLFCLAGYYAWSGYLVGKIVFGAYLGLRVAGAQMLARDPKRLLETVISSPDERAAAYKAVMLRKEFGLVDQNGRLLSYDLVKDTEDLELTGDLAGLWRGRGAEILAFIQELQKKLPELLRMSSPHSPSYGPDNFTVPYAINEAIKGGISGISQDDLTRYNKLRENLRRSNELLIECLTVKMRARVWTSPFPQPAEVVQGAYIVKKEEPLNWNTFINGLQFRLKVAAPSSPDPVYARFWADVKAKKSPEELFGFPKGSEFSKSELKKKYTAILMVIHADKSIGKESEPTENEATKSEETTALLECLNQAYKICLPQAKEDPADHKSPVAASGVNEMD